MKGIIYRMPVIIGKISLTGQKRLIFDNDLRRSIHYPAYYTATCRNEKITFHNLFFTSICRVDQQRNSLPKTLMWLSNRVRWG